MTVARLLLLAALVLCVLVALSAFGTIHGWSLITLVGLLAVATACLIASALAG